MSNTSTKVYPILTELKVYLDRDLEKIHNLSEEAETEEKEKGYSASTTVQEGPNAPYYFVLPWPPIARATIPQSLALLSIADYLGFLIKTTDNNHRDTEKNIVSFFSKAAGYGICNTIPMDQLQLLVQCGRHGMMHNYFPKLNLEVSYHSQNPIRQLFFINTDTGNVVLNITELKRIVLETFDKLLQDSDTALYQNMESHYNHLELVYATEVGGLIQSVKASL